METCQTQPIAYVGRAVVLVHDYEEALSFYRDKLGFVPIADITTPSGMRFLHVGPPDHKGIGIWLLKADSVDQKRAVGRQTGGQPVLVMYTGDCHRSYELLRPRGVHFLGKPVEDAGSIHVHFADLYGNRIVLVQLLFWLLAPDFYLLPAAFIIHHSPAHRTLG